VKPWHTTKIYLLVWNIELMKLLVATIAPSHRRDQSLLFSSSTPLTFKPSNLQTFDFQASPCFLN
jgi:hypothetical protein